MAAKIDKTPAPYDRSDLVERERVAIYCDNRGLLESARRCAIKAGVQGRPDMNVVVRWATLGRVPVSMRLYLITDPDWPLDRYMAFTRALGFTVRSLQHGPNVMEDLAYQMMADAAADTTTLDPDVYVFVTGSDDDCAGAHGVANGLYDQHRRVELITYGSSSSGTSTAYDRIIGLGAGDMMARGGAGGSSLAGAAGMSAASARMDRGTFRDRGYGS